MFTLPVKNRLFKPQKCGFTVHNPSFIIRFLLCVGIKYIFVFLKIIQN